MDTASSCFVLSVLVAICGKLMFLFMEKVYNDRIRQQGNKHAHLDKKHGYAHFSQITTKHPDPKLFPLFQRAQSVKLRLQAGDVLYIPPGWWHWIISKDRSCSFNLWFDKPVSSNDTRDWKSPHRLVIPDLKRLGEKWSDAYIQEKLGEETPIFVWRESQVIQMPFEKYCTLTGNNAGYLITLDAYDTINNLPLKMILQHDTVPITSALLKSTVCIEAGQIPQININFWIKGAKSDPIDTGLHYDDYAGYLCVCDGTKDIELFSPDQTPFLYPHKI